MVSAEASKTIYVLFEYNAIDDAQHLIACSFDVQKLKDRASKEKLSEVLWKSHGDWWEGEWEYGGTDRFSISKEEML